MFGGEWSRETTREWVELAETRGLQCDNQQGGVLLQCDSQNAIYLAMNQVYHARTKHIDVRFHRIRELVSSSELLLEKVHTSENAADMLTKPVTADKFKHCLDLVNISRC